MESYEYESMHSVPLHVGARGMDEIKIRMIVRDPEASPKGGN